MSDREQALFAALADPVRRSVLSNLAASSPRTATHLAQEYTITRQGLLKHLEILKEAGLVSVRQEGREKLYTLNPASLAGVEQWLKELGARWDERLLRLKSFVENEE